PANGGNRSGDASEAALIENISRKAAKRRNAFPLRVGVLFRRFRKPFVLWLLCRASRGDVRIKTKGMEGLCQAFVM
ncbi:MAG: hypothetical protein JZU63_03290, partial [Rhodoferax sp.]|nr:hypothetical protein [Rhodoferax sp.]